MTAPSAFRCGVLLAGGTGTRFGSGPKGRAALGDGRVADAPLAALVSMCDDVLIAANHPDAVRWFPDHRIVRDAEPGRGALATLETALLASVARTIVVCAWDMPFVDAAVLEALAALVDAGASCAVPTHADGRVEPLCAAYAASCRPVAAQLLASGVRAGHALFETVEGTAWPIAEHMTTDAAERTFFNVNTPADLTRAAQWSSAHDAAP